MPDPADVPGKTVDDFGHLDLSVVVRRWDVLRGWAVHAATVDEQYRRDAGLSARKFDESQPAGHRAYIGAHAHIGNGIEHIDALQALMTRAGVTPRAPWTLLRSVYEAGFWSTWLLEPDDGVIRRHRGLRAEVQSMRQRTAFYEAMFKYRPADLATVTEPHAEHEKTYRAEARALGVEWSTLTQRINVEQELGKLRVVNTMENDVRAALEAQWRSLSGMQHGHAYAVMLSTDEQPGSRSIPGGRQTVVTLNDNAFYAAALSSSLLLLEGLKLYVGRTTHV